MTRAGTTHGRRTTRRRALSIIEMLIVVAVIAILVGGAVPYVQDYLREARSARTAKGMDQIRKALGRAGMLEGLAKPHVVGTPHSVSRQHRPEFGLNIGSLIPRYLGEKPVDSWGQPIYRFGNFLGSNGEDRGAGTADDVHVRIQELPAEVDPDSTTELRSREEYEAEYQATAIALALQEFVKDGAPPPPDLPQFYLELDRSSPPDPWGHEYVLVDDAIVSSGQDGELATADDIRVVWRDPEGITQDFSRGIHGWTKAYPTGDTPATTPIEWDAAKEAIKFAGRSRGGMHQAYWVLAPPATLDLTEEARVSARFEIEQDTGNAAFGVILNYQGPGSGIRGHVEVGDPDGFLRIQYGVPQLNGKWIAPPSPPMAYLTPFNPPKTYSCQVTLEVVPGSPQKARLTVTGGVSGSVEATLPKGFPSGPCGVYVMTASTGARFDAWVTDFTMERAAP